MKPDWDKLMKNWNKGKKAANTLIADVDCTSDGGKALCEKMGVKGYPTIKWGDPNALEDYSGGREYDDLKKWAKKNLKPICSPKNIELCDDEKKQKISELQALKPEDLTAQIEAKQAEIKLAEETFDKEVKALQAKYETLQKEKEEAVKNVKDSGLGLMLSVQAAAKETKKEEL
eukprot:TRINITY_DN154_c0_g2_i1.p1 TRINITY_DN154_c0_g2~~TRINITY_DN154_c0_g2_i1.p1  ORF type:complete len:174 (+),score=52.63 TRINITY_DN154_c0_g2_i1:231-752(+)